MNLFCSALIALVSVATATAYSLDCIPPQIEMNFEIIVMDSNGSDIGYGRFHQDLQDKNITVMNITKFIDNMAQSILFLGDSKANRSYTFNSLSGECRLADDSDDSGFNFVESVYLGAESDKIDAWVFESKTATDITQMTVSKKTCIPLSVKTLSDKKVEVMSFFNATLGIKDTSVLSIPEKCKAL